MRSNVANQTPPIVDDATTEFDGDSGTPGGEDIPFGRDRPESPDHDEVPPTRVRPPKGYPDDMWHNDGLFAVEIDLRPLYVAEADAGTGSITAWRAVSSEATARVPNDDGGYQIVPLEYELFAHIKRRNAARRRRAQRERAAAAIVRDAVECAVCGAQDIRTRMRSVRVGGVLAIACPVDAPSLELELRSREQIADGRARGEAVRAAADRLTAGGNLPPLELRSAS